MKSELTTQNAHPERTFTRTKLLMMTIGTFVGSGLVSLTGPAASVTGYSVWLAYILAVVIGFLAALPFVCITSVMNFNGGAYTVAITFLGNRFGGAFVFLQVLNALILSILAHPSAPISTAFSPASAHRLRALPSSFYSGPFTVLELTLWPVCRSTQPLFS